MKPYGHDAARVAATRYALRFGGRSLRDRVAELVDRYPAIQSPAYLSWEGYAMTNCGTTAALKNLLATLDTLEP